MTDKHAIDKFKEIKEIFIMNQIQWRKLYSMVQWGCSAIDRFGTSGPKDIPVIE